jgi:hypothetical protein
MTQTPNWRVLIVARRAWRWAVIIISLVPVCAGAQELPDTAAAKPEPARPERTRTGPCTVKRSPDETVLDRARRDIFEAICWSAADFDRLFGDRPFDEQARRTNGRAGVRVLWDERDGVEADGKLNANVEFPNLDNRVNGFLGRTAVEDFVLGREAPLESVPSFFESQGDEEWLAGFGYRPVSGDRNKVQLDAGVEAGTPLEPFARARYRHHGMLGGNLFRFRQSVYWTRERELGASANADLERPLGEKTLGRWTVNGVIDGQTAGTEWESGVTVFHGLPLHRAIAWYAGVKGKTEGEATLQDVGTRITYRRRMLRDWFFGEFIAGVTWSRDNLTERWRTAARIGFGFEMQFSGEDLGAGQHGE